MQISIKNRIYGSFFILTAIFVINGIISVSILSHNTRQVKYIHEVVDPSLQLLEDFNKMMIESKMYTTNWVYLDDKRDDKSALEKLHNADYPQLKERMKELSSKLDDKSLSGSLNRVCSGFEHLLAIEQGIMNLLKYPEDYENPTARVEAERLINAEIIPGTAALLKVLSEVTMQELKIRTEENGKLESDYDTLKMFIYALAFLIICFGVLLSFYMTGVITSPIGKIIAIVNDLGKGKIKKVDHEPSHDEIGEMVTSVNDLSENLKAKTEFAYEIGNRNFDTNFKPLSGDDMLGNALITMRDNLKYSDERFTEAQHIAKLGSWEINYKKNKVYWSDEMFNIFEVETIDLSSVKEKFIQFIHPGDKEYVNEIVGQVFDYRKPVSYECRIITTNGHTKFITSQCNIYVNENGEIEKTFGIIQDITERKEVEDIIQANERKFRALIENSSDAIMLLDQQGRVMFTSDSLTRILGFSYSELAGRIGFEFVQNEDLQVILNQVAEMMAVPGKSMFSTQRILNKNGEYIWCEGVMTNLLHEPAVKGIIFNFRDITERRVSEEALKAKNTQLTKSNMELDKFVYSVSHDLRAPLRSILGVVEISESFMDDTAMMTEHLGMIKKSVKRLDGFILDILDYSRNARENVKQEEINFKELLNDIINNLKFMGDNNQRVDIKIDVKNGVPMRSDKNRISVILNNLISNSIRYKNPKAEHSFVRVNVEPVNLDIKIVVEDNGIGIDKKFHDKIFDMFYRVSASSIGSGLGLYIVKESLDKLNGRIELDSEPEKGSRFSIYIPNSN